MADMEIEEEEVRDQIELCDSELRELKPTGADISDIESTFKIARSLFKLGSLDKAYRFAARALRLIEEKKNGKSGV